MISVIIPVYNGEKYLEECLDSILNQIYTNFEIIIVNDGSTDNSLKICRKYQKKDKRIRIINTENHGVSHARNIGIKESKGDYITFVDCDDKINSFGDISFLNLDYDIVFFNKNIEVIDKDYLIGCIMGLYGNKKTIAGPYSKFFKKSFIDNENLYFNESMMNGEDMFFNIECLLKSKKIKIINQSFYLYRINPYSITNNFNNKIIKNDEFFQKKIYDLLMIGDNKPIMKDYIAAKKINGIYTISSFICRLKKYKEAKKFFNEIDTNIYEISGRVKSDYVSIKQIIIYRLFTAKMYFIIFIIFKFVYFKKKFNSKNIDFFVEI